MYLQLYLFILSEIWPANFSFPKGRSFKLNFQTTKLTEKKVVTFVKKIKNKIIVASSFVQGQYIVCKVFEVIEEVKLSHSFPGRDMTYLCTDCLNARHAQQIDRINVPQELYSDFPLVFLWWLKWYKEIPLLQRSPSMCHTDIIRKEIRREWLLWECSVQIHILSCLPSFR